MRKGLLNRVHAIAARSGTGANAVEAEQFGDEGRPGRAQRLREPHHPRPQLGGARLWMVRRPIHCAAKHSPYSRRTPIEHRRRASAIAARPHDGIAPAAGGVRERLLSS